MEGLGNLFNVVPTADAVEINLRDASGVTFICVGADTYTLAEAQDAAGTGAQTLTNGFAKWYTNAGAVGATAWVEATNASPDGAEAIAANAAVYVDASQLSDDYSYVRCSSTAAGLVIAIVHGLKVGRNPAQLPAAAA